MQTGDRVHFVGIGGYGMGPLARIMLDMGFVVSGSDMKTSERTERMLSLGAEVSIGHGEVNLPDDADYVVISAAVPESNPEVSKARRLGIPVYTHAEMVGDLLVDRYGIGISGAHGKTTTTSMVSTVLNRNGLSPTVLIGGEVDEFSGGGHLGTSEYFVVEADEAYGRFLKMHPRIGVVTNIDDDHLDYYGTLENVKTAFRSFIAGLPPEGAAILNIDCERTRELALVRQGKVITYSVERPADVYATDIALREFGSSFVVWSGGARRGTVELSVPGVHNVSNALVAVAVGEEVGIPFEGISAALRQFSGVHRRFELHGMPSGVMVVDDYAHHPTEIQAVLRAARTGWDRRLIAVFQPQRFTRTQSLMREFALAFDEADIAIIADIYYEGTGEEPIPGVNSGRLLQLLQEHWHSIGKQGVAVHVGSLRGIVEYLRSICREGDLIITMGAGNICTVAKDLVVEIESARQGV